jgi:transposase
LRALGLIKSGTWVLFKEGHHTFFGRNTMSVTLLYQGFYLQGYTLKKLSGEEHCLFLELEPQPHRVCCSECHSMNVIRRGHTTRTWRHLPIGKHCTWVQITVPRVECRDCGVVRQIHLGFAEPRYTYTRAFERYVLELSRYMVPQDISLHLGVSWDIVKDIQKRHLQTRYAKPRLKNTRRIAIDEICIGRGFRFLTIVLDLDSGAIVFVGNGKNAESLAPFWRRLRASRAKIKAVAMDMSKAYRSAVEEHLPTAAIVFDRFHVMKLMNEKLTQLRRELYRQATGSLHQDVLKGTRWLLLKNHENLDPVKGEPRRLQQALKLNESLATAYYLKEDLRQLWEQPSQKAARLKLLDWYHQAMASGVRVLQVMARTLLSHQAGLLAWYDHPISTGPLEGVNNKIKTMQRQHYGLRDQEFQRLKLYQLHETKYALVG